MAVLMNQVMAKTKASSAPARRALDWLKASTAGASADVLPSTGGMSALADASGVFCSKAFSGKPTSRCRAAQLMQAVRQPQCSSSQADSGQPMVLARPAISVMPVIGPRERWP